MMRELHADTHILNAFVFQNFNGALVTGVQISGDGTARMDFDLPDADSSKLRALEDLIVKDDYIPHEAAHSEHGLIQSKSVAPSPAANQDFENRQQGPAQPSGSYRACAKLNRGEKRYDI